MWEVGRELVMEEVEILLMNVELMEKESFVDGRGGGVFCGW